MRCRSSRVAGILLCGVLLVVMVGLAACGSQTASPRSSQESVTTATSEGSTTATTIAIVTTDVPTTERTITSSTELITPATGPTVFDGFIRDARAIGVQIYEAQGQRKAPVPGEFVFKAHVAPGQIPAAYEALAERLLAMAEKHKQEIYFDRLHMILVTENSQVVYEHTFQVTPPSSTTSTTQQFTTYPLDTQPQRSSHCLHFVQADVT